MAPPSSVDPRTGTTSHFSSAQGLSLYDLEHTYDEDGNGVIDHDEFKHIVSKLPGMELTAEQNKVVLQELDENNDGIVALDEMERQMEIINQVKGQGRVRVGQSGLGSGASGLGRLRSSGLCLGAA